jgi:hypothetical protein
VPELGEPEVEPALAPAPAAFPDETSPLVDEPDDPDDGVTEPDVGVVAPEDGGADPVALTVPELGVAPDAGPPLVDPVPDELVPDDALGGELPKPQAVAAPPTRRRTKSVDRRFMYAPSTIGQSARKWSAQKNLV